MRYTLAILLLSQSAYALVDVQVVDGEGSGHKVHVTEQGGLEVNHGDPHLKHIGDANKTTFFSGLLGTTGIDSGVTNMAQETYAGSSVTYKVNSNANYDIHIMKMVLYLQDGSISHSGFGALSALDSGISINVIEGGVTTSLVLNAKSFADLIQQTAAERPFGDASRAFELDAVSGTEDALVLPMDIASLMPNKSGIRIGRATDDRIEAVIRDDIDQVTTFTVRLMGWRHYP